MTREQQQELVRRFTFEPFQKREREAYKREITCIRAILPSLQFDSLLGLGNQASGSDIGLHNGYLCSTLI